MRDYGTNNFVIAELAYAFTWRDLLALERLAIAQHGTMNKEVGYNMTEGGTSCNKFSASPRPPRCFPEAEPRFYKYAINFATLSCAEKGRLMSFSRYHNSKGGLCVCRVCLIVNAHRASDMYKRTVHSEATKAKIGASRKGRKHSAEHIANRVASRLRNKAEATLAAMTTLNTEKVA